MDSHSARSPAHLTRIAILSALAMVAFAGNSLLCRMALASGSIDPATFTLVRLVSGAVLLAALVCFRNRTFTLGGDWRSAVALCAYAAGFSFAYTSLTAATGALLLFGAVQATMIGYGAWSGERLGARQITGAVLAAAGLVGLLLPGLEAPSPAGALLMLAAGIAWGIYSLRGRGAGDPTRDTAGNFVRAALLAAPVSLVIAAGTHFDTAGLAYAIASGALASGLGYAIWYTALPHLKAMSAAIMQLSVPVLTAVGGVFLLGEPITTRLVVASAAILGGVALFLVCRRTPTRENPR